MRLWTQGRALEDVWVGKFTILLFIPTVNTQESWKSRWSSTGDSPSHRHVNMATESLETTVLDCHRVTPTVTSHDNHTSHQLRSLFREASSPRINPNKTLEPRSVTRHSAPGGSAPPISHLSHRVGAPSV